jgi:hypothetical protein
MRKFRTDTHDAPAPFKPTKAIKPGVIAPNRIGVYDGKGRLRGQVGPRATAVTASRFTGQRGMKLGKVNGRDAWIGPTLAEVSAQGTSTPGSTGDTIADISSRGATATQIKTVGTS